MSAGPRLGEAVTASPPFLSLCHFLADSLALVLRSLASPSSHLHWQHDPADRHYQAAAQLCALLFAAVPARALCRR